MAKKISIGIIGGGMIGVEHIKVLRAIDGVAVSWLAETAEDLRGRVASEYAIPNTCGDYKKMLVDKALDAVVVCTPPHLHKPMGITILRSGKHLLMEKPLARTLKEAEALVAEAKRHPKLVVSGCSARHARYNPKYVLVKRLIDEGKLGKIYHVYHCGLGRQGRPGIEYNPGAKWFLDRDKAGGGPLFDWGVYDLSFHRGVLGEPEFLGARAFCVNQLDSLFPTGNGHVEEHGAAFLSFKNNLTYYWERAFNAHSAPVDQTRIYGTKGGVTLGFPTWCGPEVVRYYVDRNNKAQQETLSVDLKGWPGDLAAFDRAFVKALQTRGAPPMSIETELDNLRIIDAVYKAAKW